MEQLEHAVFGNGSPGIKTILTEFIARSDAREEEKMRSFAQKELEQRQRDKKLKEELDRKDAEFKYEQATRDKKIEHRNSKITILISLLALLFTAIGMALAIYWHHLDKKGVLGQNSTSEVTSDSSIHPTGP
jgi:flagellar basal body-associated protein FliL